MGGFFYIDDSLLYVAHEEGRALKLGSSFRYEYNLTDHLGNVRVSFSDLDADGIIDTAGGEVLQLDHYYPFGMRMGGLSYQSSTENRYRYNGKEYHQELNLGLYDYGARMYDPSIGRWNGVDALADIALEKTPYHFVSNNPINRIDPSGLTDFKVNKETGEINQVGDSNNEPDRILKTDGDGNVKKKGEGFLGFLVKESERGKPKVAVDDISKGILEDGLNLKENDGDFEVNGEGQPSLDEFNKFISEFSDYLGKEIAGIRLGEENSTSVNRVKTYRYKNNTRTRSGTPLRWFSEFGGQLKGHFHTHPYNDSTPSEDYDIPVRNRYPNLPFFIIAGGDEKEF